MNSAKYKIPSCKMFKSGPAFVAFIFATTSSIDIHLKMLNFMDSVYIVHIISMLEDLGARMYFVPLDDGSFLFRLLNVDPVSFDLLYRVLSPQ